MTASQAAAEASRGRLPPHWTVAAQPGQILRLRAPREKKGQVIGVYSTCANGMQIGSGFTVGLSARRSGCAPHSPCPQPRFAITFDRFPTAETY